MYNPKEFGARIKKLRLALNLTQEQLAAELNISTAYVGRLEIGIGSPSLDMAIHISTFFDVSLDYLILGINLPSKNAKKIVHEAIQTLVNLEKEL